jgi:hypothetical protein
VVAAGFAGDLLCEIFGDVFLNLAAHDMVHWCEQCRAGTEHDRVILCVRVGVARDDIYNDHVEQADDFRRWHVLPRHLKHIL